MWIPEFPEHVPPELMYQGDSACTRLKNFFNPHPANPNQLTRQKELVAAIVGTLKDYTNVFYEIGNELRMDGCAEMDNCQLAEWINLMNAEIYRVTGYVYTRHIGTSTGIPNQPNVPPDGRNNEEEIFQNGRCPKRFIPTYFDFHSGQWMTDNGVLQVDGAIVRVQGYVGSTTIPPLIINDDGAKLPRNPTNLRNWAMAAFNKGLHYSSKEPYPNGGPDDFNFDNMTAMEKAANDVP
ncbi:MAG: hypothetical protein ICV68_11505 [Pyrinomonadaceae bacterium]|nr:hypothetical protein [Pyrinomonadaceae bacterium]